MSSDEKRYAKPLDVDTTIEGTEAEPLSVISAEELKERAEFEESTGLNFDSHNPSRFRRDEICETFGSTNKSYKEPTLLQEAGTSTVINSINTGKFCTGKKGFLVGRKAGFMGYPGRGFLGGVGVGFDYSPTEGFGKNFMTGSKGFEPIGFDTTTDPNSLPSPTICKFPPD